MPGRRPGPWFVERWFAQFVHTIYAPTPGIACFQRTPIQGKHERNTSGLKIASHTADRACSGMNRYRAVLDRYSARSCCGRLPEAPLKNGLDNCILYKGWGSMIAICVLLHHVRRHIAGDEAFACPAGCHQPLSAQMHRRTRGCQWAQGSLSMCWRMSSGARSRLTPGM